MANTWIWRMLKKWEEYDLPQGRIWQRADERLKEEEKEDPNRSNHPKKEKKQNHQNHLKNLKLETIPTIQSKPSKKWKQMKTNKKKIPESDECRKNEKNTTYPRPNFTESWRAPEKEEGKIQTIQTIKKKKK